MASLDELSWSAKLLGGHPISTTKTNISTSAVFDVGASSIVRLISILDCWVKTSSTTPATAATSSDMYIPLKNPTHIAMNSHRYLSVYTGSASDVYVTKVGNASYAYESIAEGIYKNNG